MLSFVGSKTRGESDGREENRIRGCFESRGGVWNLGTSGPATRNLRAHAARVARRIRSYEMPGMVLQFPARAGLRLRRAVRGLRRRITECRECSRGTSEGAQRDCRT